MMERLYRAQTTVTRALVLSAGWALFLFSFVVSVNVISRKLFSVALQGIDEYGGYALAIAAAIGFSQAAIERIHIRIDIVTRRLPISLRSIAISFAIATLFCTMSYLFYHAYLVAEGSFSIGALATSVLRTPLWIPQGLWTLALGWCSLVLLTQLIISLSLILRGRWEENLQRFESLSVEEEVQRELGETEQRLTREAESEAREAETDSRETTR